MAVRQENTHSTVLRTLEIVCAAFFAFLGSGALFMAAKAALQLIGELIWRLPKGGEYLRWDMLSFLGLITVSAAMFSTAFLITANAFWHGRWSRRIILRVIFLALAGLCMFIASAAILGAGLSQID